MLIRPKDSRPLLRISVCVYRIPCKDCNEVYIGETGRHLEERLNEHKKSVKKATQPRYTRARARQANNESNASALGDHVAASNHTIAWDDLSVLATHCSNRKGRWIRESICIRADTGHYSNRNEGAYQLSRTWDKVLIPRTANPGNANNNKAKPVGHSAYKGTKAVMNMTTDQ